MGNPIGTDIAIVILNWNGSTDTRECVRSLLASDARDARIVVFDNGSILDQRREVESLEGIHFLASETNLGFAEGNNEAVRRLPKEVRTLIFLNNDTEVPGVWLRPLIDLLDSESPAIVSPAILRGAPGSPKEWWFSGSRISWFLGRPILGTREPPRLATRLPYVPGCCLAIRRSDWDELGGFDSRYFAYFEDTDLCLKASRRNIQSWIEPRSVIWHKVSRATGEYSPFRIELFTRNRILFMRRFANRRDFASFFATQVCVRFLYSLKYLLRPDGKVLYGSFVRGVKRGFTEKDWN